MHEHNVVHMRRVRRCAMNNISPFISRRQLETRDASNSVAAIQAARIVYVSGHYATQRYL